VCWTRSTQALVWGPPGPNEGSVPARGLILFGDFTDLVASGVAGLAWEASDLVSDDLRIADVSEEAVTVEGLDAAIQKMQRLEIDLGLGSFRS
jgi:hypothetical protein